MVLEDLVENNDYISKVHKTFVFVLEFLYTSLWLTFQFKNYIHDKNKLKINKIGIIHSLFLKAYLLKNEWQPPNRKAEIKKFIR